MKSGQCGTSVKWVVVFVFKRHGLRKQNKIFIATGMVGKGYKAFNAIWYESSLKMRNYDLLSMAANQ